MEQRTGKTATSLFCVREWQEGRILVTCPKIAISVWEHWIPLMGMDPTYFDIVNFEAIPKRLPEYERKKYIGLIVDESHRLKNRSGAWSKAVFKLSKRIYHKLLLTGTYWDSGYEDLYGQLRIIDPDRFHNWSEFENRYLVQERIPLPDYRSWKVEDLRPGQFFSRIVGYKNKEELEEILMEISCRVERSQVSKVKTQVKRKKHIIPMSPTTRMHYKQLESKLWTEFKGRETTAPLVITLAIRLQQLVGGFLTADTGEVEQVGSEKLECLEGLLEGLLPAVVVARFHPEISAIKSLCQRRGWTTAEIHGKSKWNPKLRPDVTILQPQSGLAIDLSYSKHMVIYSQDYSFINWSQFKDRIVQVDTPEVYYHHLQLEDSIDQIVYDAVVEKRSLTEILNQKYGQGHLHHSNT